MTAHAGSQELAADRDDRSTALVLGGGGARAAYQAGVLRFVTETFPEAAFPILSGVSAGAINVAYLANHVGDTSAAAEDLLQCWLDISSDQVFQAQSALSLSRIIHQPKVYRCRQWKRGLSEVVHSVVRQQYLRGACRKTGFGVDAGQ